MFEDVRSAWLIYWGREVKESTGGLWQLAGEVDSRLCHLDRLLREMIAEVDKRFEKSATDLGVGRRRAHHEAFYMFAWRLMSVWNRRDPRFRLPNLPKLKANGVARRVRNQLIEHPEKYAQAFGRFYVTTDDGIAMKALHTVFNPDTGKEDSSRSKRHSGSRQGRPPRG